jgi:preprotein translocase subunit SecF
MRIFTNVDINWLRYRWQALIFSWVIILAGVALVVTRGLPLGIDFSGGTLVVLQFQKPVSEQQVRSALATAIPGEKVVQQYGSAAENQILVRLPQTESVEQGFSLEKDVKLVIGTLRQSSLGDFEVRSTEVVGPVVGRDLQRRGIYATVAAMLGIMLYIALRFRFSFGIGAMVASLHDVLVTLSVVTIMANGFGIPGYELSLNVIAAILTLVGYGVNDQIVIFDRVRENLHKHHRDPLDSVINKSVNQTLPRTVITAGTAFLSVLALYAFGGEVLKGFAFAMLIGIVTSTYSTVFIASAIAVMLGQRNRPAVGAAAAAGAAPSSETRKAKARKVNAR